MPVINLGLCVLPMCTQWGQRCNNLGSNLISCALFVYGKIQLICNIKLVNYEVKCNYIEQVLLKYW